MGGGGASERSHLMTIPLKHFQVAQFMPSAIVSVSILTESRFHPLRYPALPDSRHVIAGISAELGWFTPATSDFSRCISRAAGPLATSSSLRDFSSADRLEYPERCFPSRLFHPICVGRANALSPDAINCCLSVHRHHSPSISYVCHNEKAAVGRTSTLGAARVLRTV